MTKMELWRSYQTWMLEGVYVSLQDYWWRNCWCLFLKINNVCLASGNPYCQYDLLARDGHSFFERTKFFVNYRVAQKNNEQLGLFREMKKTTVF